MTRERIEDFREIVLPFLSRTLLKTNYENMGKSDAEEFEKDFNEILDLAIKALEQKSVLDKIRVEIRKKMKFNSFNEGYVLYDDIEDILDKYKADRSENGKWANNDFGYTWSELE